MKNSSKPVTCPKAASTRLSVSHSCAFGDRVRGVSEVLMHAKAQDFTWFVPEHGFVPEINPFADVTWRSLFRSLADAVLRPARNSADHSWSLLDWTLNEDIHTNL